MDTNRAGNVNLMFGIFGRGNNATVGRGQAHVVPNLNGEYRIVSFRKPDVE
jgi:hypothetical protein